MNWREFPLLKNRLHPDYPDDIQVIVHDGGPRITNHPPELVWVRITKYRDGVFVGTVLNAPHNLTTVKEGDSILFLVTNDCQYAFRVTPRYLTERKKWRIIACDKCGFSELFDPPSQLIAKIFPHLPPDATSEAFTSFCPLCGGIQIVADINLKDEDLL
jgi:hypothetical protein